MTTPPPTRTRILDPLERFSEIVFGLIVVLSFTGALSVASAGQPEVRHMMIAAILCNLAWGIIDAAFYLISCIAEHSRNVTLLLGLQQCVDQEQAAQMVAAALPPKIAGVLRPDDFQRIHTELKQMPSSTERLRLTRENWLGALGVCSLVFFSTFPVVVPFIFIQNTRFALHVSNAVAITLLFGCGHMLARHAGLHRIWTGLLMVVIGAILVAVTIALGG